MRHRKLQKIVQSGSLSEEAHAEASRGVAERREQPPDARVGASNQMNTFQGSQAPANSRNIARKAIGDAKKEKSVF